MPLKNAVLGFKTYLVLIKEETRKVESEMKTRRQAILNIRFRSLIDSLHLSELSEVRSGRGALNTFVSGLILSSAIMEEIRQEAPYNVHVSWGQILDENDVLSGEVDIMTYLGKPLHEWKSIGYAIIQKFQVGKIIEVKRNFQSYRKHEKDFERLSKFGKIFLIVYQTRNTIDGIKKRREKLKALGYQDVFHLIRLAMRGKKRYGSMEYLYGEWYRLMDTVGGKLEMGDF